MSRWPALLACAPLLGGCSLTGDCSDRVLETQSDLTGDLVAYRYVRNCGATTGYSTQVAIGQRGGTAKDATPIFVADDGGGGADDMDGGAVWTEMRWTKPHHLSIAYSEGARVFRNDAQANGAQIVFRATRRMTLPSVD